MLINVRTIHNTYQELGEHTRLQSNEILKLTKMCIHSSGINNIFDKLKDAPWDHPSQYCYSTCRNSNAKFWKQSATKSPLRTYISETIRRRYHSSCLDGKYYIISRSLKFNKSQHLVHMWTRSKQNFTLPGHLNNTKKRRTSSFLRV